MRALLDVNMLIALLDSAHVHHSVAQQWMSSQVQHGWASCPITQNGCIRIMSQPNYPGGAFVSAEVAARLGESAVGNHKFWPDDINLIAPGALNWARLLGHRQITDAYLLALAVKHSGRMVSLDRRISAATVFGATDSHIIVVQ